MAETLSAGERMIASAKQALAFARGEDNGCVVHIPYAIDTARIRGKFGMSQTEFATYFGLNVKTVRDWEQGRAVPSSPAQALIRLIDANSASIRASRLSPRERARIRQKQWRLKRLFRGLMRETLTKYHSNVLSHA